MSRIQWAKRIMLFMVFLFCLGCAETKQASPPVAKAQEPELPAALDGISCPSPDDLRGVGTGPNAETALAEARSQISLQVSATVSAQTRSAKYQQLLNGNERLSSRWTSEVYQTTHLVNGEDARPVETLRQGNRVGIVACMSRADATAPMRQELRILSDSLLMAINAELSQEHPLLKKNARGTAEPLYVRYLAVRHSISSLLGNADEDDSIGTDYARMVANYDRFRSHYAFFWTPPAQDDEGSAVIFAGLSSHYKMETGECTEGLRLSLESASPTCRGTALGIECVYQPALRGRSCSGENYFLLQASAVRGIGRYNEDEALQRLFEKLKVASFWNEWIQSLDQWRIL
ncbi:MAG: LPP20 family lipoprotein [Fibrobacteraceae bacterium]|nr:LPP20 family lipoprotein [Fibrobacteraceae bacterium]